MIAQEFENLTSTYNKTISSVILQIWSDTTTKYSLQQSFYFYRMQDVLLKGTVKVLQDYFYLASSNLNQALLKLGQKTSTLNSSLAKSFISADEANQRSLKIENQIKSALSAHCKDEEARDDKRFTVINGNDDDVQNLIIRRINSRSEVENPQSMSEVFQGQQTQGGSSNNVDRVVAKGVQCRIFTAANQNTQEYHNQQKLKIEFDAHFKQFELNPLKDIKLQSIGKIIFTQTLSLIFRQTITLLILQTPALTIFRLRAKQLLLTSQPAFHLPNYLTNVVIA